MVSTRRVVSLLTPEEKIAHLAHDHDRDLLAWVEGSRAVHLGRLNEAGELEHLIVFSSTNTVNFLSHLYTSDDDDETQ